MMAINHETEIVAEPNTLPARPELLMAAVLHLMSHYTARAPETGACLKLASVIERHLQALADLPELAPVLRATCSTLSEQWATIVDQSMPKPKQSFFARMVAS